MLKGLDMNELMKKAKELQKTMADKKKEAVKKTVDVSVGGGMIHMQMNGNLEALSVKIDPEIVDRDEIEILEDLFRAACNEAIRQAKQIAASELTDVLGGMNFPDLSNLT